MSHKKQGLALTLTKEALQALFPVGTEAYTQIRQSVLQNFVDAHIKPRVNSDVTNLVNQISMSTRKKIVEDLSQTSKDILGNSPAATELITVVKNLVDRELQTAIPQLVEQTVTDRLNNLKESIDLRVKAYTDKVEQQVSLKLSQAIANNVIEHLRTTLNEEIGKKYENTDKN